MYMSERRPLSIVSISHYGGGLASSTQFSGALDRQRDYARALSRYVVIVPGVTTLSLPIREEGTLSIYTIAARNPLLFSVRAYLMAVRLMREVPFDACMVDNPHLGGVLGLLLKVRLRIPLVVHAMADMLGNPWYRSERRINWVKEVMMRIAFHSADIFRVSTESERARLVSLGYAYEKIFVVPFYIDRASFQQKLSGVEGGRVKKRILYVGRLGPQKDVGTLLTAFARVVTNHPDARLVIVGTGPEEASLEVHARVLGITEQVVFRGAVPYGEVAREFSEASLFALSSLYEGTCMVMLEAALARLPIVSTDHAGARDFIRDGVEGFLVPVRDSEALANALDRALASSRLGEMGDNAYERLAAFDARTALSQFELLLEAVSVLRSKRSAK